MTVTIWHNPRCSKSRQTLALIEESGASVEVRHYLQAPPDEAELRAALTLLGIAPKALMRRGEKVFKDLGLAEVDDETALLAAMVTHPILIERPVVFANGQARIGRPPESVREIL